MWLLRGSLSLILHKGNMMNQRIIALDVGDKYIGIAVSDPLGVTAQGYRTYKKGTREDDLRFFSDVFTQFNTKSMVAGLPKNLKGELTAQARKTINYCQFLKKRLDLTVHYIDERFSTEEAKQVLREGDVKGKDHKKYVDTLAAQLILQVYLEKIHNEEKKEKETHE
jgi:putative Holliday junction resolvase